MVNKQEYEKMVSDRPRKFTPAEVGYRKAPRGSEQRCENCAHLFARKVDAFHTCEIMRSPETDERGVDPKYLCNWWTHDLESHPLAEESTDD